MPTQKNIIITGASSGMGFYAARELSLQGHHVIACVRNTPENRNTIDKLVETVKMADPKNKLTYMGLELSELESVLHTSERIKSQFPIIDVLICNAGVMKPPWTLSEDKYELQFQINFLSHLYLTLLIQNQLLSSQDPRVINICSLSAEKGSIADLESLKKISKVDRKNYHGITSYRESKLAQLVSVFALGFQPGWEKVHFSAVHPGVVNTSLFYRYQNARLKWITWPFVWLGYATGKLKTVAEGADTAIWLATKENAEHGYWHNRLPREPNPIAKNDSYGKNLLSAYSTVLGFEKSIKP